MGSLLVDDRKEAVNQAQKANHLLTEQKWQAIVFLVMLILTAITGIGLLCYKVEHPVAFEILKNR